MLPEARGSVWLRVRHRLQPPTIALQAQPRHGPPSPQQSPDAASQPQSHQPRDTRPRWRPKHPHQKLAPRRSLALRALGRPLMRPRDPHRDDGARSPRGRSREPADPSTPAAGGLRIRALRRARSPQFARASTWQSPHARRGPHPYRALQPDGWRCLCSCARPWVQPRAHHPLRPITRARPRGAQRARLRSNPTPPTSGNQGPAEESVESGFRAPAVPSRLRATRREPGRGQHEPPHHPIRMG